MAIRCDRACAYPAWTSKPVEIWSRDSDDLNNTLFVDYLAYNEEVPLPRYWACQESPSHCTEWPFGSVCLLKIVEPNISHVPQDAVAALLFYNSPCELHPHSLDSFLSTLPKVVDGNVQPPRDTPRVYLSRIAGKKSVGGRVKGLSPKMRCEKRSMVVRCMAYGISRTPRLFHVDL